MVSYKESQQWIQNINNKNIVFASFFRGYDRPFQLRPAYWSFRSESLVDKAQVISEFGGGVISQAVALAHTALKS